MLTLVESKEVHAIGMLELAYPLLLLLRDTLLFSVGEVQGTSRCWTYDAAPFVTTRVPFSYTRPY